MKNILVVEDDKALVGILSQRFTDEGYSVQTANSISQAKAALSKKSYDLALIDVGLPDGDGFSIAQEINDTYKFPYIFLTAMGSPEYRLEGYELGATDYIPKPFHFKELKLRVEKVLGESKGQKPFSKDGLTLNPESLSVKLPDETPRVLNTKEFTLLYALFAESPKVFSRKEILEDIWQTEGKTNLRAVDNCIVKLRGVLGDNYSKKIRSIRGAGYQWL